MDKLRYIDSSSLIVIIFQFHIKNVIEILL